MIKQLSSILIREIVLVLLCILSFFPALLFALIADHISIHLYSLYQGLKPHTPSLTTCVAETLGGYHMLSFDIIFLLWLTIPISFVWLLAKFPESLDFRLHFIPFFLFIWILIVSYFSLLAAAYALPKTPLFARLESYWLVDVLPFIVFAEILVLIISPLVILYRHLKTKRRPDPIKEETMDV
jgi:hypothetical protein